MTTQLSKYFWDPLEEGPAVVVWPLCKDWFWILDTKTLLLVTNVLYKTLLVVLIQENENNNNNNNNKNHNETAVRRLFLGLPTPSDIIRSRILFTGMSGRHNCESHGNE